MVNIKRCEEPPEIAPQPSPAITPEMISDIFQTLSTKGMIHYDKGAAYIPTERGWRLLMSIEPVEEVVEAFGHPEIEASSLDKIKIVKGNFVKDNGVIGVRANKSCVELSKKFKDALKSDRKLEIVLEADDVEEVFSAYCSPALELTSKDEVSISKDDMIDASTIGIMSEKAASDLKRELVEKLKNPNTKLRLKLKVKPL
jgi:hypothetical protein